MTFHKKCNYLFISDTPEDEKTSEQEEKISESSDSPRSEEKDEDEGTNFCSFFIFFICNFFYLSYPHSSPLLKKEKK